MSSMLHFEIITPERVVYQDAIDAVTLSTQSGEITILPNHTPLVSVLKPGEMVLKKGNDEVLVAVAGGFVQVEPGSKVIILADAAERAEDIDELAAEEARARAEELKSQKLSEEEYATTEASLLHALARLKVVQKHKTRRSTRMPQE